MNKKNLSLKHNANHIVGVLANQYHGNASYAQTRALSIAQRQIASLVIIKRPLSTKPTEAK